MIKNKKHIGKNVLSIFLALLMALSCFSAISAFAASEGGYWSGRHWFRTDGDNRYAFCIHASATSGGAPSVSSSAWTYWNNLSATKRTTIEHILTVADSKGMLDAKSISGDSATSAAVTYSTVQRAIWETLGQYGSVSTSFYTQNTSGYSALCNSTTYSNLVKKPSFGSSLKLDAILDSSNNVTGYSKTFTDKNGVLDNYKIDDKDGLTVSKSGNKITVSCGKNGFDGN